MDEQVSSPIDDVEAARIKHLEDRLASPDLQGMNDDRYWPRQAVFDELLDVLQARNRRRIEENWCCSKSWKAPSRGRSRR